MADRIVIYGATGYSGGIVARRARDLGLWPVLCGRDPVKLARAGAALGLEHHVADVADPRVLDAVLADARVVVNAAGPFAATAGPLVESCLRTQTHYLDLTAEAPVAESLAARDREARARRVMVMPAVGFNVVATDCLARHVANRLATVRRLAVATTSLAFLTRGSAKTLVRAIDRGFIRRDGVLRGVPYGSIERSFDFGRGARPALNVSLADAATAYYSVGAVDIETYVEATPLMRAMLTMAGTFGPMLGAAPLQVVLAALADVLPEDPTDGRDAAVDHAMHVVVEAEDHAGRRASARMRTPDAYAFTGTTAAAIVERVLASDVEYGFQTPARVYGSDFVLGFSGVEREDLA